MRMITCCCAAATLVSAGCARDNAEETAATSTYEAPPEDADVVEMPRGGYPPADQVDEPDSFVGQWAANVNMCDDGAWSFSRNGLTTAGEVSCEFSRVSQTTDGWIAEGSCVAETPAAQSEIELKMQEDGRLAVSGGPFAGKGLLVRCPV